MPIKMTARMKKLAAKHPKTVSELVKQLKAGDRQAHPLVIEALDTLNINHGAQYNLLKAIIDQKIRMSENRIIKFALILYLATLSAVLLAAYYG